VLHETRGFLQVSPAELCEFVTDALVDVNVPVDGLAQQAAVGSKKSGDRLQADVVACNPDVVISLTLDGGTNEGELRDATIDLVRLALEGARAN